MGAEDINRRSEGLGLEFSMAREAGGHWVLRHAGGLALFLGTNEEEAARDARMFLCGITHVARHRRSAPEACRRLIDRMEAIMGEEPEGELPGWCAR